MTVDSTVFVIDDVPRKRGRPKQAEKENTLSATKPWVSLGMSRRTFFRRKAAAVLAKKEEWVDGNGSEHSRSSNAA